MPVNKKFQVVIVFIVGLVAMSIAYHFMHS